MATLYSSLKRMGGVLARAAAQLYPISPPPGAMIPVITEANLNAAQVADVVNVCTIQAPASYRLRELNHADLGAGVTISVGRAGAAAEQLTATGMHNVTPARPDTGFWRDITADEDVIATIGGAAATGRVQFVVDVVQGCRAAFQA